jgi:trimeric autotransporter adhesin
MRSSTLILSASLLSLASSFAHAQQKPAAPEVTTSANLKELVFDWDPVPNAYTYWLLEKPYNDGRRTFFTAIKDRIPGSQTFTLLGVAVHQFNWWENKYIIAACNTAGCTRSAEMSPLNLMLDSIGYVKASNADPGDNFGRSVILSADGSTLAVSAPGESSIATGVNGNQADNSSAGSGAVYVFKRTGRSWAQEAYLKGGVNHPGQRFGAPLDSNSKTIALSADGSWLAVGAPAQGTSLSHSGVVYLFRRNGAAWTLATTLQNATPSAEDQFGFSVDMSQDGRTLKVSSLKPLDGTGNPRGRTHIYVRPGDTWQHSVTLAPYFAGDRCPTVRMTGNGRTLIAACANTATGSARGVMLRLINNAWVRVADIPLRAFKEDQQLAVDYHGTRLWIWDGYANIGRYYWKDGAWTLESTQLGPQDGAWPAAIEFDTQGDNASFSDLFALPMGAGMVQQSMCCGNQEGAAYMYRYVVDSRPVHQPRPIAKAPNPGTGDGYGTSISFSGNGRTFAVGAPGEDSAARGVDGNRASEAAENSGAVYLY